MVKKGKAFGKYFHRTKSGAFGAKSIFGILANKPGVVIGIIDPAAKTPALPYDVPEAGPSRSIKTTSCPARCNHIALETPFIPAPATITLAINSLSN